MHSFNGKLMSEAMWNFHFMLIQQMSTNLIDWIRWTIFQQWTQFLNGILFGISYNWILLVLRMHSNMHFYFIKWFDSSRWIVIWQKRFHFISLEMQGFLYRIRAMRYSIPWYSISVTNAFIKYYYYYYLKLSTFPWLLSVSIEI